MSHMTAIQSSKLNRTLKLAAGGIVGLALISLAVLALKNYLVDQAPPAAPADPSPSAPLPGSLMAWVDGSTLMFVPAQGGSDNNGEAGQWITLNPISNFQFSLCVQAGRCGPPADPESLGKYDDPTQEDKPVAARDQALNYCEWILGTSHLTPQQIIAMLDELDKKIESLQDDVSELKYELKKANEELEKLSEDQQHLSLYARILNDQGPGSYAYLAAQVKEMIAELEAALEQKLAAIEGAKKAAQELEKMLESMEAAQAGGYPLEVYCMLYYPLPMPLFTRTNAFLDPADPVACDPAQVSNTQQFCQNGIAYQTIDLIPGGSLEEAEFRLPEDASGDGEARCDQVAAEQDRILCSGGAGPNPPGAFVDVSTSCEGSTGVACQAGSVLDDSGCVNRLDSDPVSANEGWTVSTDGVMVPADVDPFPNGALAGPVLQNTSVFHGMMITSEIALGSAPGGGVACPAGYYLDPGASDACVSLGAPRNICLAGYEYDPATGCKAFEPGGNYPGCRNGEVFDPVDGLCEPLSKVLSPTSVLLTTRLPLDLPDCTTNAARDDRDGAGSTRGGACTVSCP